MNYSLIKIDRLHKYLKDKTQFRKSADLYANDILEISTSSTPAFFEGMFIDELKEIEEIKTKHLG